MRILYIGPNSGTSAQRFAALRRLGHEADLIDPRPPSLANRIGYSWSNRTGGLGTSRLVRPHLERQIRGRRYDLAFVDGGELLGPELVRYLGTVAERVINFNLDNPFVSRDGPLWRLFLKALPVYDLFVTPRRSSVEPARAAGASNVFEVTFSADEVAHLPPSEATTTASARKVDVIFVGTWMPERSPFILGLVEGGLSVRAVGPRWKRAPEYPRLADVVTDQYLAGDEYARAVASAKIGLALLSKGNEDLRTTRSFEIPAIGTLLCAERTSDHRALYDEGREAVFFEDVAECIAVCRDLLADPVRIDHIAAAGQHRLVRNGNFNETVLKAILERAFA